MKNIAKFTKMGDTKSTPANPRVYIYRYFNIDPKEGLKYVQKYVWKALELEKGQQWYKPEKKRSTKML